MYITLIALIAFLVVVTGGLSLRMFFEKKKGDKDWSAWANLISAAGTVVVGVATIFVMFQENNIQTRLAQMEEAEHQPLLIVEENSYQSDENSVYDYEEFSIYNRGALVKQISEVSADVFIRVDYNSNEERFESFIPIRDYYFRYYKTGALEGDIAHSYGSFKTQNVLNFKRIYDLYTSNSREYVNIELVKFFTIEYIDIYGNAKRVRFKGHSEVSDDYYTNVCEISKRDFNGEMYELERIPEIILMSKIILDTRMK